KGQVLFVPLKFQPGTNCVDAALAKLIDPKSADPTYSPIRIVDTNAVCPPTGKKVQKLGAATKLTTGTIDTYCSRMEVDDCEENDTFNFVDIITIKSMDEEHDFADDGDSGALVISADDSLNPGENKRPVGLLFAVLEQDKKDEEVV